MECAFIRVGGSDHCHKKPTKTSNYCSTHKFLMKNTNVKPCLYCSKRTFSRLQICEACGANKIRVTQKSYYNTECRRLRNIQ